MTTWRRPCRSGRLHRAKPNWGVTRSVRGVTDGSGHGWPLSPGSTAGTPLRTFSDRTTFSSPSRHYPAHSYLSTPIYFTHTYSLHPLHAPTHSLNFSRHRPSVNLAATQTASAPPSGNDPRRSQTLLQSRLIRCRAASPWSPAGTSRQRNVTLVNTATRSRGSRSKRCRALYLFESLRVTDHAVPSPVRTAPRHPRRHHLLVRGVGLRASRADSYRTTRRLRSGAARDLHFTHRKPAGGSSTAGSCSPASGPYDKLTVATSIYDPETTPGPRRAQPQPWRLGSRPRGQLYVVGGCGGRRLRLSDVLRYDPSDEWSRLADYPRLPAVPGGHALPDRAGAGPPGRTALSGLRPS